MDIRNGFEEAFIIHKDGIAYDSGVCAFAGDDIVNASIPDGDGFNVAYRFGDGREDDELPPGLTYMSASAFMDEFRDVIIVTEPTHSIYR